MKTIAKTKFGLLLIATSINISAQNSNYLKDNTMSYYGVMTKEQLLPLFKMANDARQKAYETGETEYYDALNMGAIDPNNLPEGAVGEGYDYYMTARAGKETYPNYS